MGKVLEHPDRIARPGFEEAPLIGGIIDFEGLYQAYRRGQARSIGAEGEQPPGWRLLLAAFR